MDSLELVIMTLGLLMISVYALRENLDTLGGLYGFLGLLVFFRWAWFEFTRNFLQ